MGTGTGVGMGWKRERRRGWRPVDDHRAGTGTGGGTEMRTGSGTAEERRRSARHYTRGLDAIKHFHSARHHLCRQGVTLAGTRPLHSQGPGAVHVHRTEEVTGSEGRREANGVGGVIGVGGGNGDVNSDGDGDGVGAVKRAGMDAKEGTQYKNRIGDGSGDGAET